MDGFHTLDSHRSVCLTTIHVPLVVSQLARDMQAVLSLGTYKCTQVEGCTHAHCVLEREREN